MMKKGDSCAKLAHLREAIKASKQPAFHAVIVPSSDAHQSGELVDAEKKVKFLSGFTGPAVAVVTENSAAIWTNKKYYYQAELQLDENWILMKDGLKNTPTIGKWLCSVLSENSTIAINPMLFRADHWDRIRIAVETKGHQLFAQTEDIVNKIWTDRPVLVSNPLEMISPSRIEQDCSSKVNLLLKLMVEKHVDWLLLTTLDEVAWVLNLTGSDLPFSPLFNAYVVIGKDATHFFVEPSKVSKDVEAYLKSFEIRMHGYSDISSHLKKNCCSGKTWLSQACSYAIMSCITEASRVLTLTTPVAMLKCCKTKLEIEGILEANNRDAVAFCRFLHWLESNVKEGNITECSAGDKLNEFRKDENGFVSIGFDMMSCAGINTSVLLYCNSLDHDTRVKADAMYMIDSGAFFRDQGSTDSCRTVHYGTPTDFEKTAFTLVLQAHIDLASAVFPCGTKGHWLASLAKLPLWKHGLDFDTTIGHGIGFFQSIEGPPGVHVSEEPVVVADAQDKELKAGMFLTDEPGYYERGEFGIRIENTLLTVKAKTLYQKADKQFLQFKVVSFIPIQKKMIIKSMLTDDQITWLDNYHQQCLEVIGPRLRAAGYTATYEWLKEQTTPL